MTDELTALSLTEWYKTLEGSYGPEDTVPDDSPWGPVEHVDQYRDYSNYYYLIKIDDRYFRYAGYYDSWNGVEWSENYEGWEEVVQKERVEKYWDTV